jgi:flagellar protein FlbD
VIILTRLGGHALAVNPDLIERAESTPDTVLTMVDGHKMIISESLEEVVELVRTWRSSIAAQAYSLSRDPDMSGYGSSPGQPGQPSDRTTRHPSSLRAVAPDDGRGAYDPSFDNRGEDGQLTAHTAIQASLARVLRMPQRGE